MVRFHGSMLVVVCTALLTIPLASVSSAESASSSQASSSPLYDYCVVGAGPAGLQMGYYLHQKMLALKKTQPDTPFSYIVLEKGSTAGAFFMHYPRHRQLISINKRFTGKTDPEYNLRHDWNSILSDYDDMYPQSTSCTEAEQGCAVKGKTQGPLLFTNFSKKFYPQADDLVRYLSTYASSHSLNVQYNISIDSIRREIPPSSHPPIRDDPWRMPAMFEEKILRDARNLQQRRHDALTKLRQRGAPTGVKGRYQSKKRRSIDEEGEVDDDAPSDNEINLIFRERDDGGVYTLQSEGDSPVTYRCTYLIMSTGISKQVRPELKGIEFVEDYSEFDPDPETFSNQSVLILGKGNSAFETAAALLTDVTHLHVIGRSQLRFAHQTHYVGDLRAVNDDLADVYQLKSLGAVLDADISPSAVEVVRDPVDGLLELRKILSSPLTEEERLENRRYKYHRIINCLGFKFDDSVFEPNTLLMDARSRGKYPSLTSSFESSSPFYPNLYFAGTIQHMRDWRQSSGGFIHGFRYSVRTLFKMLQARNHAIPWPREKMSQTLENTKFDMNDMNQVEVFSGELATFLLERANIQSAMYQLFGRLSEVVLLHSDDESNNVRLEYLKDVPVDYLFSGEMNIRYGKTIRAVIVLTLEFNPCFSYLHSDVFSTSRAVGNLARADKSNFLHPVLRFYRMPLPSAFHSKMHAPHAVHHVIEDVTTIFDLPERHHAPLTDWISRVCISNFITPTGFQFPPTKPLPPTNCAVESLARRLRGMDEASQNELFKTAELERIAIAANEMDGENENWKDEL